MAVARPGTLLFFGERMKSRHYVVSDTTSRFRVYLRVHHRDGDTGFIKVLKSGLLEGTTQINNSNVAFPVNFFISKCVAEKGIRRGSNIIQRVNIGRNET